MGHLVPDRDQCSVSSCIYSDQDKYLTLYVSLANVIVRVILNRTSP